MPGGRRVCEGQTAQRAPAEVAENGTPTRSNRAEEERKKPSERIIKKKLHQLFVESTRNARHNPSDLIAQTLITSSWEWNGKEIERRRRERSQLAARISTRQMSRSDPLMDCQSVRNAPPSARYESNPFSFIRNAADNFSCNYPTTKRMCSADGPRPPSVRVRVALGCAHSERD